MIEKGKKNIYRLRLLWTILLVFLAVFRIQIHIY
jgi:hypothetical protein